MAVIQFPLLYVPNPTLGRPLFNCQIFVGEPDLDPEIVGNQKQLNVIQEDGTVVPVSQPFVTSAGGVPTYNGKTVLLDVDGNYSFKVLDNLGVQKYYIQNVFSGTPITGLDLINDLSQAHEFATVAEYKAFTTAFPVGKVVNTLEFATGKGGGASYTVIASGTENAYNIIKNTTISQSIDLITKEFVYLEQVGADNTGVVDSGGALKSILDLGLQVKSESNGAFNVASLSNEVYVAIDLQGPFTLVGDVANAMFASNEDFTCDNVTVTDSKYLIGNDSSDSGQVLNIGRFHLTNNTFERMSWCTRIRTYAALAVNKVGNNVIIENNKSTDVGSGIMLNAFIFGYSIKNNEFKNVGDPLLITSAVGQCSCISIGQDNSGSDEPLADSQGSGEIHNNRATNINNASVEGVAFTNFIQMFSSGTEVHGNFGNDLTGGGVDQEGIYIKGSMNKIHNNTLIDCGHDEGSIKQKGVNSGNGIKGTRNHYHNNYISWTVENDRNIGISSISGENFIHDNVIVNPRGQAISVVGALSAIIHDNKIIGLKPNETGTAEGILLQNTPKGRVINNEIQFDGSLDGTMIGVIFQATSATLTNVESSGNEYTLVNEKVGATGSYRLLRVIDGGNGVDTYKIDGERFLIKGAVRQIFSIFNEITGTWNTGTLKNSINDIESVGATTDIAIGGSPSLWGYGNNTNFTTLEPVQSFGSFGSAANAINTLGKKQGKQGVRSDNNRPVYAAGPLATDIWVYSDGSTAFSP